MKISAIICELNPLHDGHRHIFKIAKQESDAVIAIMSGNYVQRAEPAVYNKYYRAKEILNNGADLCIELPFPFSSSSAEYFSKAAIYIAEKIGATDLYFGCECNNSELLSHISDLLNTKEYNEYNKKLGAGERKERFIKEKIENIDDTILKSPNDILAIEYYRWSTMNMHPIKRIKCDSASIIRQNMYNNNPKLNLYDKLLKLEFYHYRTLQQLNETAESNSGINERLLNTSYLTNNYREWLELVKTKRYTNTRFKRAALYSLFNIYSDDLNSNPSITNILAFNEIGKKILYQNKFNDELTLVSKNSHVNELNDTSKRNYEIIKKSDTIYSLISELDDPYYFLKQAPYFDKNNR